MDLEGNFSGAMHVCPIPVTSVEKGSFCKLRRPDKASADVQSFCFTPSAPRGGAHKKCS